MSSAIEAARRFLTALDETAEAFTFQTFADREDASEQERRELTCILHGRIDDLAPRLESLNQRGAGIFVTVNATDLKGRSADHVVGVRALFADLDGAPLPQAWPIEPHIVIESSPRRWHAYFLASGVELSEFRAFQASVAAKLHGDAKVIDLPRVMRLPGFAHRKSAPFITRIESIVPAQPYDRDTLARAFPPARGNGQDQGSQRGQHQESGRIPKGGRNAALMSLAGSMRRRGMSKDAILAALFAENAARCDPPLAEAEVKRIAESTANYAPGAQDAPPEAPGDLLEHAFWIKDAKVTLGLPYVVKGIFGRGQIVVMWGRPGAGKSFVTMEMSACIGAGARWRGRRTRKGIVLYVAAESARAYIENRLAALKAERPDLGDAEVLVVPLALDLLHAPKGDVERVLNTAKALQERRGELAVIVIDTLAVTFGGGDENDSADMGQYVRNILHIREKTGAAVLIVHHCGKDEARGMRGHSALLGALDAELAIEGEGGEEKILRTGKVRDGDGNADLFAFTLRPVELGTDPDGDPVRTCVVDSKDEAATKQARRRRKGAGLGKNQKAVLRALEERGGRMPRIDLAHKLKDEGMPRNRVHDAIATLLDSGMLVAHNDATPPEVSLA